MYKPKQLNKVVHTFNPEAIRLAPGVLNWFQLRSRCISLHVSEEEKQCRNYSEDVWSLYISMDYGV